MEAFLVSLLRQANVLWNNIEFMPFCFALAIRTSSDDIPPKAVAPRWIADFCMDTEGSDTMMGDFRVVGADEFVV